MTRYSSKISRAIFLVSATAMCLHTTPVVAYDLSTHAQIVIDAFEYILSADPKIKYLDGATGESDYTLVRDVLAPNITKKKVIETNIQKAANTLAEASKDTDLFDDVYLKPCALCSPEAKVSDVYFTLFSHFLDVVGDGAIWPIGGYYYGRVERSTNCSAEDNYEDKISNYFVKNLAARLDVVKSNAMRTYKEDRKPTISVEEYYKAFDQDIKHIHFWPITNLADYWYAEFLDINKNPKSKTGQPFDISLLGPVLHAVADVTVPFHAVGLSGCGHREYEANVERWYVLSKKLYDRTLVAKYLSTNAVADQRLSLKTMLSDLARTAAGGNCKCTRLSCSCPIVRDEKIAKSLVNLAVASSVVAVRKGFTEWKNNKARGQKDFDPILSSTKHPYEGIWFSHWSDVPVQKDMVIGEKPAEIEFDSKIVLLKGQVSKFSEGDLDKAEFKITFLRTVDDAAEIIPLFKTGKWDPEDFSPSFKEFPNLPPIHAPEPQFRPPTLEEIEDNAKWKLYMIRREQFNQSNAIFEAGKRKVALKAFAKRAYDKETLKVVDDTIQSLDITIDHSATRVQFLRAAANIEYDIIK